MHLPTYLTLLSTAEDALAQSHRQVADEHTDEADVHYTCATFAAQCHDHVAALVEAVSRYDNQRQTEPDRLYPPGLTAARSGPLGLLRDLQELYQLASFVDITWAMVGQAADGGRDHTLLDTVSRCHPDTTAQLAWLRTRMQAAAPQTLLVAP